MPVQGMLGSESLQAGQRRHHGKDDKGCINVCTYPTTILPCHYYGLLIGNETVGNSQEAGRVVAESSSGAIGARTEIAGETEIQSGADEPTAVAFHCPLVGKGDRTWLELIEGDPAAVVLGKGGGGGS